MKPRKYIVPIIQHCSFGLEVEVTATSAAEAKAKAIAGKGADDGQGFDWNRFDTGKIEIGNWQRVHLSK